jgi:hypothetical protein
LVNKAFSAAVRRLWSNGVLESETASSAPAVADNIATPVKLNQSQNQFPCFTFKGFIRMEGAFFWTDGGFS